MKIGGGPLWRKYYDENGQWDRISYLCHLCYEKYRQELGTNHNAIRNSLTKCRTGYIDRYTSSGIAIMDQAIVAKILGVEDLNIKFDNFTISIDMKNDKLGTIDVKSSSLKYDYNNGIEYWDFRTKRKIDCDTYICLGYDMRRHNIIIVLIIPNDEDNSSLGRFKISKNSYRFSIYDKFKVDHKCYNDKYRDLLLYLKDKKFFGVEDIKRWMKI